MNRKQFVAGVAALFVGCKSPAEAVEDDQGKWMDYASGPQDRVASHFIKARLAIAPQMQRMFFGFSGCERCGLPWPLVPSHSTFYWKSPDGSEGRGASPLCEDCWSELGVGEYRWPYYKTAWERYSAKYYPASDLELLRKAVMAEKGGSSIVLMPSSYRKD